MDSFPRFMDLPVELRVDIWRRSRQPRVVEVWYDADADCCRTTAPPPALLHVNREARAEALHQGWYRPAFRTRSHSRDHYIFFSPALDVLYLPRHGLMGYDDTARDFTIHVRDTAEHVRALAIDHVRTETIRPWEPYNKLMLLLSFPHVEETMLVVGPAAAGPARAAHDQRMVRGRPQDSIESGTAVSRSSATSRASSPSPPLSVTPSKGDVVLVDPQGDAALVMDVINNVIESFSHEIDATAAAAGSTPSVKAAGFDGNGDSGSTTTSSDIPHIPYLIPKAIAYHRQQQQQQQQRRQRFICA